MIFRNLTLFRIPASVVPQGLVDLLAQRPLNPVGPSELESRGWIPPMGRGFEELVHQPLEEKWITLGGEKRILPASVVNSALGKKVAEIEDAEGRKLGGRARKRLKEDLVMELLPRALVKPSRLNAYIDAARGFIAVDTSGRRPAESLVSELRHALGSFPALPLNAERSVRAVLTGWLAGEPLPEGFSLGEECVLQDPIDGGGVVRCSREELRTEQIEKHLEAGKQVSRLGLVLDDRLSFTIDDKMVVRKLKFLDGAIDELEQTERDDQAAELSARFVIMAADIGRLFGILEDSFKISKAEG